MNNLSKPSHSDFFSHLYIEESVIDEPLTKEIISKFSNSKIIMIKHYKDVFNRPNQDFAMQSRSKNLILARREAPFLYEGSYYSDGFEYENFFYTPSILGCLYDCDYCYLSGMYNSANSVLFVNTDDFFEALTPYLEKPTLIAISYDTDTLAIESITSHTKIWIEHAAKHPNLHLEIRTKSANFKAIKSLTCNENIVLAWTLSPQKIIESYEHKTPSLEKRLRSIKEAIDAGWKVRVCIDPVIYNEEFHELYPPLIDKLFNTIEPEKLFQLTLGSFRMSSTHLKRIKKLRRSDIAFYPYEIKDNIVSYSKEIEQNILETMIERATNYIPRTRIRTWQLQ
ncbi:radical SAM protein [bacterium]|nr:radical SAM protein [bacterium]MBU1884232.1 radical SAM protein [bacterium]